MSLYIEPPRIYIAHTKVITVQLTCAFVFAYAKIIFSHVATYIALLNFIEAACTIPNNYEFQDDDK